MAHRNNHTDNVEAFEFYEKCDLTAGLIISLPVQKP